MLILISPVKKIDKNINKYNPYQVVKKSKKVSNKGLCFKSMLESEIQKRKG